MYRIQITPQWQLAQGAGFDGLPRLVALLVAVHDTGTLRAACARLGLSYRHAWGLIKRAEGHFGAPFLISRRGQGAKLSVLGEKLVWADRRIAARLGPVMDSLSAEIETEIERALTQAQGILRLHASHGFAVETLRARFSEQGLPLDLRYCSSTEALAGLAQGRCDLAGFHVPTGRFEAAMRAHYGRWLDPTRHRLIQLATRRQGLMAAPGNPLNLSGLGDLSRPGLRFVNRQPEAATRYLLDLMLKDAGVEPRQITGYDVTEFTHAAVAAYIASDMADVGFGVETPAQRFGLHFLPLITERYYFACTTEWLESAAAAAVLEELRNPELRTRINALAGYDAMDSGTVLGL